MKDPESRSSGRTLIGLVVAAGLCLLALDVFVPALIAQAYRGESLAVFNGVFEGRGQHSLDMYLREWDRLAEIIKLGVVGLMATVILWRWRIAKLVRPVLAAGTVVSPLAVLWLGAWFGGLAGLGESLSLLAYYRGNPARGFGWEKFWMAPPASALAFLLVAMTILLLARASVRSARWLVPVAIRFATFVFALLAAYAVAARSQFGLETYAAFILSAGLATVIARLAVAQNTNFLRLVRLSSGVAAAALLVASVAGLSRLPSTLEHRRRSTASATSHRPNVLLIVLDAQRASNMSLYGYERETTPNLSQFASHGVVFDRAIATAPWTLPSHASVFTGRYPHEMSADIGKPLDGKHETLAEVLADSGYATAAFVANQFYTTEASGLARGFARYEDYPVNARTFVGASWLSTALIARPLHWAPRTLQQKDERVTTSFIQWAGESDTPFFAFLNYMGAHTPYPSSGVFTTDHSSPANVRKQEHITTKELEGARTGYDNGIAGTDREIGRVLHELDRLGKLDQTIVIVTADHGEHLGEHGLQEHTNSLYMPLLEVPLVVVHPGQVPQGTRVPEPVSLRDIPATVLELAGLRAGQVAGSSLSRHWSEPSRELIEPVLSELNYWGAEQDLIKPWDPVYGGSMKSLVLGDLHYIRGGHAGEEVFDLSKDPAERVNLKGTLPGEELRRLRATLDSIIR